MELTINGEPVTMVQWASELVDCAGLHFVDVSEVHGQMMIECFDCYHIPMFDPLDEETWEALMIVETRRYAIPLWVFAHCDHELVFDECEKVLRNEENDAG